MSEPKESIEAIIARDMAAGRKANELRHFLHELQRTIQLRPIDGEMDMENVRAEFTNKSAEVIAPLLEALDCLREIIYASDGCVGHRNCAHSMEPWQRARKLLYGDGVER